jgi:hypothetical protein
VKVGAVDAENSLGVTAVDLTTDQLVQFKIVDTGLIASVSYNVTASVMLSQKSVAKKASGEQVAASSSSKPMNRPITSGGQLMYYKHGIVNTKYAVAKPEGHGWWCDDEKWKEAIEDAKYRCKVADEIFGQSDSESETSDDEVPPLEPSYDDKREAIGCLMLGRDSDPTKHSEIPKSYGFGFTMDCEGDRVPILSLHDRVKAIDAGHVRLCGGLFCICEEYRGGCGTKKAMLPAMPMMSGDYILGNGLAYDIAFGVGVGIAAYATAPLISLAENSMRDKSLKSISEDPPASDRT